MIESWWQDARYALRLLRKSPLFTVAAAVSLAIGIGATATIFSVASALLLRPPIGVADHGTVVDVGRTQGGDGFDSVSYPNYRDIRDRATTLSGLYAYELEPNPMSLGGRGEAERVYGTAVTGNYFQVLGTQPLAGRLLQPADDAAGRPAVAVISHELWRRRFSADPAIVGRDMLLNGTSVAVVGVAPAGFQGTTLLRADLWVPVSASPLVNPRRSGELLTMRRASWLFMGGRLAPGATLEQARAELQAIGASLEQEYPEANKDRSYTAAASALVPGRIGMVAGFLALLMTLVVLVLLIACTNVTGMSLARAAGRRREMAVRLAIGAGRGRLIRQGLVETLVLFAMGAAGGLLLTNWLTAILLAQLPHIPAPVALEVAVDWRVLLFTGGTSLAAALVAGLAPALQAARPDPIPALKAGDDSQGPDRLRLRNVLVVGQVTMSLLLIVVAGLFLRSLSRAADAQPGFDQTAVDVVSLDLSLARYDQTTGGAFVRELRDRLAGLPGVRSAAVAVDLPLDGGRFGFGAIRLPGSSPDDPRAFLRADWNAIEPGFFTTLRLPLLRGRDFSDADHAAAPAVLIVNEAFARRAWPDGDAIGRPVLVQQGFGEEWTTATVVGVASDARLIALGGPVEPYVYAPFAQRYVSRISLLVRRGEASAIPDVRQLLRQMSPNLPITDAMPLAEVTAIGLVPQRLAASVAGSLGSVGLLLAALGLYGVTAYAVSRRRREIGIRMALGADAPRVLGLVLRQGMRLAAIGVAVGVVLAALGSWLLESLLFGVAALDPVTFAATCLLFGIVTFIATYIPARAATRVNPTIALRAE